MSFPLPPRPPSCECPDPSPIPEGYLKCEPWELGTATAPDLHGQKWMKIMIYMPIFGWTSWKSWWNQWLSAWFHLNSAQSLGRGLKKVGIAHLASSAMSLNWDLQMVLLTIKRIKLSKIYKRLGDDPKNPHQSTIFLHVSGLSQISHLFFPGSLMGHHWCHAVQVVKSCNSTRTCFSAPKLWGCAKVHGCLPLAARQLVKGRICWGNSWHQHGWWILV